MKPNCIILTSRSWHEWLATDEDLSALANMSLITKRENLLFANIERLNPKYIFVPHWSHIIPSEIYENFKTIIFHMTDLPFGRGGSPLQNLILTGQTHTKISAIDCETGLDTGPIYLKKDLSLDGTAQEIFVRASGIIKQMIQSILIENMMPIPQQGEPIIFKRRKPAQSNLATTHLADIQGIYDFIRMLDAPGYPRAFIEIGQFKLELSGAQPSSDGLRGNFRIFKRDE